MLDRLTRPRAEAHVVVRAGARLLRTLGDVRAQYPRPLGSRPAIRLAVCAIFRDEAPYLAEWVAFHKLQGVERFWLYDNRSTDDWETALQPWLSDGTVTVTPWPAEPGQSSAYSDCLRKHNREARWIAFIDLDEFLFSPTGRSLPDVLAEFGNPAAVAANWRVFGTSGHAERPPGLVVETYVKRARDDHPANQHVKSIVSPSKTSFLVENPHVFRTYGPTVGEDGQPISSPFRSPATSDLLRVHHYCLKSTADIQWRLHRRSANTGQLLTLERMTIPDDEVGDATLVRFAPAIKALVEADDRPHSADVRFERRCANPR